MKWVLLLAVFSLNTFGNGYKGLENLKFSDEQKTEHLNNIKRFTEVGRQCLLDYQEEHLTFYKNHCVTATRGVFRRRTYNVCLSKFYGDRKFSKKRFQRRSDGGFLKYLGSELKDWDFPVEWMDLMEPISCVGMALSCLEKSFVKTGQADTWAIINRFTRVNNTGGTALQEALRVLGWKVLYWNPAKKSSLLSRAAKWDEEEKNWQSKGWHAYRYNSILNKGTYWFNKVDDFDTMVGFEKTVPQYLGQVPFWVGTANTGYHVFPGTFQEVVEAHSTREIISKDNLEFSKFNPLAGQGPKWTGSEKYRSGLIAVPPTY
jgi:hypothetical protein